MKALVTGASSGIGRSIAIELSHLGYDLYLVARERKKLEEVKLECVTKTVLLEYDLTKEENCYKLYQKVSKEGIDILVNNAGFGDSGNFTETSLEKEMRMLDLNVRAYHILMKLFLKDFVKRDRGRILNVASIAGFMPGSYMATYYATKAYIVNLSLAVYEELKQSGSHVKISILCPGPVKTRFSKKAQVHFKIPSLSSMEVGRQAVAGMFRNQLLIIPWNMKFPYLLIKISPVKMTLFVTSKIQERASMSVGSREKS